MPKTLDLPLIVRAAQVTVEEGGEEDRIAEVVWSTGSRRTVSSWFSEDYEETLPDTTKHVIREEGDERLLDDTPAFHVPQGHYFFMGDNRDNSQATRPRGVGFVPAENLVGKARFLFFSHNEDEEWYKPWSWPKKIRWDRLFDSIS